MSSAEAHSFDFISISVGLQTFGDANFLKSNFKASRFNWIFDVDELHQDTRP